ncbi:hypothetical protein ACQUSN_07465 [Streptomyces pseudogriseolus]|uniref:hypothetical protein n=1 Tax=Streptomyces pseudogriseolus TaxID=36817 RepID=UPI003FA26296
MNVASELAGAQFRSGTRKIIFALENAFLVDEDLANDLEAILGESVGPMGVAGARRLRKRGTPKPTAEQLAELGRALTRLTRILGRLVSIAEDREWEPPYPNLADSLARARTVLAEDPLITGNFEIDRGRLRRLAIAAEDLLSLLSDEGRRSMLPPWTFWCHATDGGTSETPTAKNPEAAVHWVRESVRGISFTLERDAFHAVWAWLGDHRAVRTAVTALRNGEPYRFSLDFPSGRLTWTVHRVCELPLVTPCGCRPIRPLPTAVTYTEWAGVA